MDQGTRWMLKYNEVVSFIETNQRNPSRHNIEDHLALNWIKHNRKLLNKGEMKPKRAEMFKELLALMEKYKKVNQWC